MQKTWICIIKFYCIGSVLMSPNCWCQFIMNVVAKAIWLFLQHLLHMGPQTKQKVGINCMCIIFIFILRIIVMPVLHVGVENYILSSCQAENQRLMLRYYSPLFPRINYSTHRGWPRLFALRQNPDDAAACCFICSSLDSLHGWPAVWPTAASAEGVCGRRD